MIQFCTETQYQLLSISININCLEMLSQSVLSSIWCPLKYDRILNVLVDILDWLSYLSELVHQCLFHSWLAGLVHLWSVYTSVSDHGADQSCPSPWPKSLGKVWLGHFGTPLSKSIVLSQGNKHTCVGPGVHLVRPVPIVLGLQEKFSASLWVQIPIQMCSTVEIKNNVLI